MEEDVYKTIAKASKETLFKDKNSKFYGYAFPVSNEEEVKECLEEVKQKHPSAGHYCYAYQLGAERIRYRVNDDGEPNNSAGMPIYGQIQSFNITNVLVVSVRYFGGTKLGVGGLISAYKNSAKLALEEASIIDKVIEVKFKLKFGYDLMNKIMRIIREKQLQIQDQQMGLDVQYVISVRKAKADEVYNLLQNVYQLEVKKLEV